MKLNNQVLHQINKGYLQGASFDVIMTLICKTQKENINMCKKGTTFKFDGNQLKKN